MFGVGTSQSQSGGTAREGEVALAQREKTCTWVIWVRLATPLGQAMFQGVTGMLGLGPCEDLGMIDKLR